MEKSGGVGGRECGGGGGGGMEGGREGGLEEGGGRRWIRVRDTFPTLPPLLFTLYTSANTKQYWTVALKGNCNGNLLLLLFAFLSSPRSLVSVAKYQNFWSSILCAVAS